MHEVEELKKQEEQRKLINNFAAMKSSKLYHEHIFGIIEELEDTLPNEEAQWWKKKN